MMAPKIGVSLLMDALGKTSGMENRTENIISICMLIFAGIVGLSVSRPPVNVDVSSNRSNYKHTDTRCYDYNANKQTRNGRV